MSSELNVLACKHCDGRLYRAIDAGVIVMLCAACGRACDLDAADRHLQQDEDE